MIDMEIWNVFMKQNAVKLIYLENLTVIKF